MHSTKKDNKMADKNSYRVLEQTFNSFYYARAEAEIQSWLLNRPVLVRYKDNGRPAFRADVSADLIS